MESNLSSHDSFSAWRRLLIAISVAVSIVAVLSIASMVNYLAQHYAPRFYWGASSNYRLSAFTLGALESLTNQIRVTLFYDRDHPTYPSVRALLREYAANSTRIQVEELDYTRNPAAAQEFRRRFPLTINDDDPALVLFESGGRTKMVAAHDLRDYDSRALMRGEQEALPVAFKGELLFTSAINAVCEGRRRRACFLQGHGEHDFQSDRRPTGYGQLAAILEEDNVDIAGLSLMGLKEIPADCEVLIIGGPTDALTISEAQMIDRYLRHGGRLLMLFRSRAQTGLEDLLADWGIEVKDSIVLDTENSDQGILIVSRLGNHAVTRPLGGARVLMFEPRAVRSRPVANILSAPARTETLLRTGTNGVEVGTFVGNSFRYGPNDIHGEIPLSAAVEGGALPGVAANLGTTRIVVVGESNFLDNQLLRVAGNRHFATSAVNWLLDRSYLMSGISPIPIRSYQVAMTPFDQRMVRTLLLGILPGGSLVVGLMVWWRRH